MKIETKKVKLSDIKPNPDNPRTITKGKMENLVKSLRSFPEMLELREIIVDENMMILGGNMRFHALEGAGDKETIVKIVTGLTDEQKREFIIKDNAGFGEWDFDQLANEWSDLPLVEWGVGMSKDWGNDGTGGGDEEKQKIRNDCENGILVCIGFCDILVHPKMKEFDILYSFFGSKYDYDQDKKDKMLNAICEEVKTW